MKFEIKGKSFCSVEWESGNSPQRIVVFSSGFRFYAPGLGYVQVPEYNRFFGVAELSSEMPLVAPGNEFVPAYAMEAGHSYYSDSLLNAHGLIANTITPVDDRFLDPISFGNLEAETMAATLREGFPLLLRVFLYFSLLL